MNAMHVMRREYRELVRKKSFIASTILGPIIMLALVAVPLLLAFFVPDEQYRIAVLDHTGEVGEHFVSVVDDSTDNGELKYLMRVEPVDPAGIEDQRRGLIAAIDAGELDVVAEIPEDIFETGKFRYITKDVRHHQIVEDFEDALTETVLKRRLAREGIDYERVSLLSMRVTLEMQQITSSGEVEKKSFLGDWGLVFAFVLVLYMALLGWGITISRSILEEKGSRIIEVLLSSVEPKDLLLGKIVGIGLAGLTQMVIWAVAGFAVSAYGASAAISVFASINVPFYVFIYFIVFFVLGFLLYASIFTVVGAVCSTEQDAQQLQGAITMPMIIPLLVLILIVESPNSTAAVVLSLIPPFTPMIMMGRIVVLEPALWQIALGIGLLVASIYLTVAFSARVFRVGILMYGKRPTPREIWKWYRSAG